MATIVAFHAHPDDEVLLTGGTIAWLAAEGHRVIIVVACDGDMWAGAGARLGELRASAAILGADRVVHLGYADSGHGPVLFEDPPGRIRFARADAGEAAGKLAELLTDEHADLLLSYDAHGGYGHRDHVRVHQVGGRAAELAGVRVVEATVPQELVGRLARLLLLLRLVVRRSFDEMRVVWHAAVGDHSPGRRPPVCGTEASGTGGSPHAGVQRRAVGPAVPRADQVAAAGIPRRLRDRVVRRAGRLDGRTHLPRSDDRAWPNPGAVGRL